MQREKEFEYRAPPRRRVSIMESADGKSFSVRTFEPDGSWSQKYIKSNPALNKLLAETLGVKGEDVINAR